MHHCISRVFTAKSRTTRCCIKWNANYLVVCYNGTQFNWYLLLLSSNVLHPVQLAGYSPSKYLIFKKKIPLKIPLNHEWWCIKIRFSLSADEYNLEGIIRNTLWKIHFKKHTGISHNWWYKSLKHVLMHVLDACYVACPKLMKIMMHAHHFLMGQNNKIVVNNITSNGMFNASP